MAVAEPYHPIARAGLGMPQVRARLFAVDGDVQLLRATQVGDDHGNGDGGRPQYDGNIYGGESER